MTPVSTLLSRVAQEEGGVTRAAPVVSSMKKK